MRPSQRPLLVRLLATLVVAGSFGPLEALGAANPTLSIGLSLGQKQVTLGSTRGFEIQDPASGRNLRRFGAGGRVRLRSRGGGIGFGGRMTLLRLLVRPVSGSLLTLNGNAYRGYFEIREESGGRITVANLLDVESYLYGVVKSEMPSGSPPEALKVQAIISRTFALKNRDNFSQRGFGLKATEESQVYAGVRKESPEARAAVDATRGVVVSYGGRLASVFYSAACGGSTEGNDAVWDGAPEPYLRPVRCTFCRGCASYHWSADIGFDEMARKLRAHGIKTGHIQKIQLHRTSTGRVKSLVLVSERGAAVVTGNKFRLIMGHRLVKSQKFTMSRQVAAAPGGRRDEWTDAVSESAIREIIHDYIGESSSVNRSSSGGRMRLAGTGFGHGVGLCQWGAKGQSELGRNHREILSYYYPGTRLGRAY